MKTIFVNLVPLVIVLCCSCNSEMKDSKLNFTNSIESSYAWTDHPQSNILWSNDAHSGNYVCKIDSLFPYSVTFNMKLSDVSKNPLQSVRISAWVNSSSLMSNPIIAVDIRDHSQNTLEWFTQQSSDFISEPNKWEKVSMDLNLSVQNRNLPDNYIRVYLYSSQKDYSLVDDIEVEFTEK
jgi:hypothetical protein